MTTRSLVLVFTAAALTLGSGVRANRAGRVQSADAPALSAVLSISKTTFIAGEELPWTLVLTNASSGPLRVVKPDWFFGYQTPAPGVEFLVKREDGRIARPIRTCESIDDIGDTADKVSSVIESHASLTTIIRTSNGGNRLIANCWSYAFDAGADDGSVAGKPARSLPPGRYRVSVRYGFPAGTYSLRWWAFLGSRQHRQQANIPALHAEEPWHGEIVSNVVELVVR